MNLCSVLNCFLRETVPHIYAALRKKWWQISDWWCDCLVVHTNGRAIGIQCCERLSSVCTECIVAKRCVLEQKLLLTAYICEIDWYQNEWPWPLFRDRIKVMSTIALHSPLNTARDRGLVPRLPIENGIWAIKWSTPKVLWGSTIGYTSDSLASCSTSRLVNTISLQWLML